MNEAETRAEMIDRQLESAGWMVENGARIRREYIINDGEIKAGGFRTGKMKADYILEYKNIKLAVVEAKSNEIDVSEGVAQAKIYAQKLQLSIAYAANGKEIYEIDLASGEEWKIGAFPSPQELWDHIYDGVNEWLERLNAVPFEDMNGTRSIRYYQEIAVNRAVKAIANNKQRILLTLATGTGKTFIAFQISWKLFKSRWNQNKDGKRQPRILFLTDRNFLANQACLDFSAFGDAIVRIDPSSIRKRGDVPKNGSVFFTIFQTFMSGKDEGSYFGQYESDFFDLIIIDECHRGGANDQSSWREILKHFSSAVHLGLTATPKRTDNVDTYEYFDEPVFVYSLKEGIKDGFLTPFKVKRIKTTIDEYIYESDDEVLEGDIDEGRIYKEIDFNKKIEIEERERKRVQEMLDTIGQNEKTIVFCANQSHAAKIRDIINQEKKISNTNYCVRVTAEDGDIGEKYLDLFKDNEKSIPTILTTSRKLTTGVDARNVRNIVLLRPIKSIIEFKQIIGRGTRLFEGKNLFTIVDFVDAYHNFNDPEWDGDLIEPYNDDTEEKEKEIKGNGNLHLEGEREKNSKPMIRIELSDGKVRELQSMSNTYFHVDGRLVGAREYVKYLFDTIDLPTLLGGEDELRRLWSSPITRNELLSRLEDQGCLKDDLEKLQEFIDARDSDLFDVLEYIAYAKSPMTRTRRVEIGERKIHHLLDERQREFVDFVLSNYIKEGVDELDAGNLSTILEAKYGGVDDAERELGSMDDIRSIFIDFQQYLYGADKNVAA